MNRRILIDEMRKIATMVKGKINRDGGFTSFVIAYSAQGNYLAQIKPGVTKMEKARAFGEMVSWIKQQEPYMFVFGVHTLKPEDTEKNGEVVLIGQSLGTTKRLVVKYVVRGDQYEYKEDMTEEVNKYEGYFDEVYRNII